MSELEYLRTISAQRGSNEAIAIAADTIEKLRRYATVAAPVVASAEAVVQQAIDLDWCGSNVPTRAIKVLRATLKTLVTLCPDGRELR